jgi:hypothetical protein
VLLRLVEDAADLGVGEVRVITRAGWAPALALPPAVGAAAVTVQESPAAADDLLAVAEIARAARGPLLVAAGDIVTQREVLAGLLADPRLGTAALTTTRGMGTPYAFRTRARAGRVVAAASAYHAVRVPNSTFLAVLKIGEPDLVRVTEIAECLARLTRGPLPPAWEQELAAKAARWRRWFGVRAVIRAGGEPPPEEERDGLPLEPADEAELLRRLALAPEDVTALLLVGLLRGAVPVGISRLRSLFWARPLSDAAVADARERIAHHDEERALLDSSVKSNDGFFTTYFVSPYSKYIARWAARRGLSPNAVTLISAGVGTLAAGGFATGERAGLIAGAVLLQAAFTLDCVDGQLARYTRTFTKLGAWLDSIFDRTKEYLVFAGLAIGASRAGEPVWTLAAAALALQTTRHTIDFSYPAVRRQHLALAAQPPLEEPLDGPPRVAAAGPRPPRSFRQRLLAAWKAGDRSPRVVWAKKIVAFPIGERFAVISLTAALFSPRMTFTVLLAWGGFATLYILSGRVLRSLAA